MNKFISKYFFYYPVTLAKGELVALHLSAYRRYQYLSPAKQQVEQTHKMGALLRHASKHSAFYRGRLDNAISMLNDGAEIKEALATVPYLTKQDLIHHHDDLSTYLRRWSSSKTTGGSTGEPVRLLKNPDALARERAATWRAYEWAGVSIGDKQARFWGVPHERAGRLKAKLIDGVSNRFRVSAFELSASSIGIYYQKLQDYQPAYLYGYVSAIELLASFIIDNKLPPLNGLRGVITTSEVLSLSARSKIHTALNVNVFNEYGCGEVGSIAHECEHGGMHLMNDNLYVELDSAGCEGGEGEIVVTDFYNYSMPLIRYRIGDYASVDTTTCLCGRTLPKLKGIHGRAYDIVQSVDGRKLHPEAVMYIFEGIQQKGQAFKHFQVIQTELDRFKINIVPSAGWSEAIKDDLLTQLRRHISPTLVAQFNIVDNIQRERSGKMRVVKSELASAK